MFRTFEYVIDSSKNVESLVAFTSELRYEVFSGCINSPLKTGASPEHPPIPMSPGPGSRAGCYTVSSGLQL